MNLVFVNQSNVSLPRTFVTKWLKAVVRELPVRERAQLKGRELTVVFLAKAQARKLNRQFRGRDYATDVLSFPGEDSSVGDLVICPDVIKVQARQHDLSFNLELGYMLLHGLLHLLGYDHEGSKREAEKMFRLQDRLFAKLSR